MNNKVPGCSRLTKALCERGAPHCKWITGVGCRRTSEAGGAPPRPGKRAAKKPAPGCSKKKKAECEASDTCRWVKGVGCKARSRPRAKPKTSPQPPPPPKVDPTKFYCVKPYDRDTATVKERYFSCKKGEAPHPRHPKAYDNVGMCYPDCKIPIASDAWRT